MPSEGTPEEEAGDERQILAIRLTASVPPRFRAWNCSIPILLLDTTPPRLMGRTHYRLDHLPRMRPQVNRNILTQVGVSYSGRFGAPVNLG
jgi:hypothetical protein